MSTPAPRVSVPAIAFIAAGGAVLLAIVAFVSDLLPNTLTLYVIAYAGIAVGLGALVTTDLRALPARVVTLVAAISWGVLTVSTAIGGQLLAAYFVVQVVTLVATLAAAVTVLITRALPRVAIPFLVFALGAGLYLLSAIAAFYGNLAALATILFGITTALLGYFLATRR